MKKALLLLAILLSLTGPLFAQQRGRSRGRSSNNTSASAGIRRHTTHSEFPELPFERRDMSYSLAWEIHDQNGFWQLGAFYTPDAGNATNDISYVVTPFINLLLKDRGWVAGVGALSSYVVMEEEKEWTSIYWQFLLGFSIPVGQLELDIMGFYPFKSWGRVRDFRTGDLEFGGSLRYRF